MQPIIKLCNIFLGEREKDRERRGERENEREKREELKDSSYVQPILI